MERITCLKLNKDLGQWLSPPSILCLAWALVGGESTKLEPFYRGERVYTVWQRTTPQKFVCQKYIA